MPKTEAKKSAVRTRIIDDSEEQTYKENFSEILEHSNQAIAQFASVAAHDLKEPLRKITSYLDLLTQEYGANLDDQGKKYLEIVNNGAFRMKNMIEALLVYSHITRKEPALVKIDLEIMVQDVLLDLEISILESGAEITTESLPVIFGDAHQIRHLFQNLISNSIKFSRKGVAPKIKIAGKILEDNWAEIEVGDNGIGINPEYHKKIFEPFRRLHTKEEYPGTGIGLAICEKIVRNHHGIMELESEKGVGTKFIVRLRNKQFTKCT